MLLVTQIYAPQDGGISLIKRFFGYAKSHLFEKHCLYLMSCKMYTPYIPGDKKVLPFDKAPNNNLLF